MESLRGTSAKASSFKGEAWIADLIYFEGPLLSLYRGPRGTDVLILWVDCDARRNRWVSFPISRQRLTAYLSGTMSLRRLVEYQNEFLFFHTTSGQKKNGLKLVSWEDFPEGYLPDEDSYWQTELAPNDALTLVREQVGLYEIGLDGESWYVEDLSRALGFYRQLYAFHYAIRNRFRNSVRNAAARALSKLAWKGGFSTVMWYNALHAVTPSMHRLRVKEIQYASPGHITLEVLPSVAADVARTIEKLERDGTRNEIQALYNETYEFFRAHGLTRVDARDMSEITTAERRRMDAEGIFSGITSRLDAFLSHYGVGSAKRGLLAAGADELGLLKAMLAYHRRAIQLAEYVDEGGLIIDRPQTHLRS